MSFHDAISFLCTVKGNPAQKLRPPPKPMEYSSKQGWQDKYKSIGEMSPEEIQKVFVPDFAEQAYTMFCELSSHVHIGEATHMRPLTDTLGEFRAFLKENEDKNLYFTEGASDNAKHKNRVGDCDIVYKSHYCIDVDYRNAHPECSDNEIRNCAIEVVQLLNSHSHLKHFYMAVFTGNGFHIHFVGDPVSIEDKDLWADGVRYIFEEFKSVTGLHKEVDMSCVNVSRLFRIPGTYNVKNGQRKLVTILYPEI